MGSTELIKAEPSPVELIQQVLASGGNAMEMATVIKELVALQQSQERFAWEREERQMNIAFNAALAQVQAKVAFVNNNADGQKGNRYSTFEAMDRALRPHYLEEGFSISFDSREGPQPNVVNVVCYLSREAITRQFTIPVIVDGSGPKGGGVMTGSQASVAAFSYGCRALLRRIFNVRTGEEDNDGNTGLSPEEADQLKPLVDQMTNSATLDDAGDAYKKAYRKARELKNNTATLQVIDLWEKIQTDFKKGVRK